VYRSPKAGTTRDSAVSNLQLYLTEGFADDHVVVRVNGNTIFDKAGVTSKKLYGLAAQLSPVEVPGNRVEVEVRLPNKRLAATFGVDLSQGSHVPLALEEGKLTHSVQKQIGFM